MLFTSWVKSAEPVKADFCFDQSDFDFKIKRNSLEYRKYAFGPIDFWKSGKWYCNTTDFGSLKHKLKYI